MREVFSQVGIGIRAYGRAFSFIFKHRLGWYFIFPLAFVVLLLLGGAALVTQAAAWVQDWVWGTLDVDNWEFFLSGALADVIRFLIWAVFKVLLYFFMAFFGGAIVLIMMSPVLAHLSEKTEKILTGTDYPFSVDQLVRDIFRGVLIALRNALIGFGYFILFFAAGFIPVIGWLAPIALFIVTAYFFGFSFMDYMSERRRFTITQSIHLIRKYKGIAVANGALFTLVLLVPFCGAPLAGFAAIVAVVAATLALFETPEFRPHVDRPEIVEGE